MRPDSEAIEVQLHFPGPLRLVHPPIASVIVASKSCMLKSCRHFAFRSLGKVVLLLFVTVSVVAGAFLLQGIVANA